VLAFELVVEDHPADVTAFVAEPLGFVEVGPIQLDVVCQLAWPPHVRVERLLVAVLALASMRLKEMLTAGRERHGALATVQRNKPYEAFVTQVPNTLARVGPLVARVAEIVLGHDPQGADGRE